MYMDLEVCYDICREYNRWLKKKGLPIANRRGRVTYCRKVCRKYGRPPIMLPIDIKM